MFSYWLEQAAVVLLVVTRIGALFSIAPFFSSALIPRRVRFILAFFVSLVMVPLVMGRLAPEIPENLGFYGLMVLEQALIGLIIGFFISTVFSAFQLAGQYFSIQIGFGMNEVVDPMGQVAIPIIGQFLNLMAILIFLVMDGAQLTVRTLYLSFKVLPLADWTEPTAVLMLAQVSKAFVGMFLIAFKLAIPVMGTIFIVSTAMGLLAKVAPQMNVMMLAFPLKIFLSFVILYFLSAVLVALISDSIIRIFAFTDNLIYDWAKAVQLAK